MWTCLPSHPKFLPVDPPPGDQYYIWVPTFDSTTRDSSYIRVVFHRSPHVQHRFSTVSSTGEHLLRSPEIAGKRPETDAAQASIHTLHSRSGLRHPIRLWIVGAGVSRRVTACPGARDSVDAWRATGTCFGRP